MDVISSLSGMTSRTHSSRPIPPSVRDTTRSAGTCPLENPRRDGWPDVFHVHVSNVFACSHPLSSIPPYSTLSTSLCVYSSSASSPSLPLLLTTVAQEHSYVLRRFRLYRSLSAHLRLTYFSAGSGSCRGKPSSLHPYASVFDKKQGRQ